MESRAGYTVQFISSANYGVRMESRAVYQHGVQFVSQSLQHVAYIIKRVTRITHITGTKQGKYHQYLTSFSVGFIISYDITFIQNILNEKYMLQINL